MTSHREKLIEELKDPAYRRAFVESHAKDGIAAQLRLMRKAEGWDQRELAQNAFGDPSLQSMVSRYENPDYGKYSLSTLLELAAAFDVALVVRFTPFSELLDWDLGLAQTALVPKKFSQELKDGFAVKSNTAVIFHKSAPAPPAAMSVKHVIGGRASGSTASEVAAFNIYCFKMAGIRPTEEGKINFYGSQSEGTEEAVRRAEGTGIYYSERGFIHPEPRVQNRLHE